MQFICLALLASNLLFTTLGLGCVCWLVQGPDKIERGSPAHKPKKEKEEEEEEKEEEEQEKEERGENPDATVEAGFPRPRPVPGARKGRVQEAVAALQSSGVTHKVGTESVEMKLLSSRAEKR